MSTDYTETLKRIKETEEQGNKEVAEKRRSLEAELKALEESCDKQIEDAKKQADDLMSTAVENARNEAEKEADQIIEAASKQAETIANKKLEKKELAKIISQVLFSGFREA